MSLRRLALGAALVLAGLVAAVGIGLLANSISGDSVGRSAQPLSAGDTLAPSAAERRRDARARQRRRAAARERAETAPTPTTPTTPTTPPADDHGGEVESGDDSSGRGRGRGRSDGSGGGESDDSGGGGSDDSSGSGSSGSGSDDFDDD
jgi:hypothetical protein